MLWQYQDSIIDHMKIEELINQLILDNVTLSQALLLTKVSYAHLLSEETLAWVKNECEGYPNPTNLPEYRMIDCTVKARLTAPFIGRTEEVLDISKINEWLKDEGQGNASPSKMRISQNIESIEKTLKDNSGTMMMLIPQGMASMILKWFSYPYDATIECVYQECPDAYLRVILTVVKNRLIDILQELVKKEETENPDITSKNDEKKIVFISYGWEDDDHKTWVRKLASDLNEHFNVKIDVKQPFGSDINTFMEKMVAEADRVLIVVTPTYKQKADNRENGVGYESVLICDEIYTNQSTIKFVPIIRKGSKKESYPRYLGNRKGVVMTDDNLYEDMLAELIEDIMNN